MMSQPQRHIKFIVIFLCLISYFYSLGSNELNFDYQINASIINTNADTVLIENINNLNVCNFNTVELSIVDKNNNISAVTWFDSNNNQISNSNLLKIDACVSEMYTVQLEDNVNSVSIDTFHFSCNIPNITVDTTLSFLSENISDVSGDGAYDLCVGKEFSIHIQNQDLSQQLQYQWVASNDFIMRGQNTSNPSFTAPYEGIFSVLLITSNQFGCSRRDQFNFSIHAISDLEFQTTLLDFEGNVILSNSPDTIFLNCIPSSRFILAETATSNTGIVNIEWRNGNNEFIGSQPQIIIEPSHNELFNVIIYDEFGCFASKEIRIIGNPIITSIVDQISNIPIVDKDGDEDLDICLPFSNSVKAINIDTSNIVTYNWTGDIVGDGHNTSTPTLLPPSPGRYLISLTTTNQYGCINLQTIDLVFYDDSENHEIEYEQDCNSREVQFSISTLPIESYNWVFIDAFGISVEVDEEFPTFEYSANGVYEVRLTPKNGSNCSLPEIVQEIVVREIDIRPSIEIEYLKCEDGELSIQMSTPSFPFLDNQPIEWTFSNGQVSYSANPIIQISEPGNFQIDLELVDEFNCVRTDNVSIEIDLLNDRFIQDSIFVCNNQAIVELNPTANIDLVYKWGANASFSELNLVNPIFEPTESASFGLNIQQEFTNYNCESNTQIELILAPFIDNIVEVQDLQKGLAINGENSLDIFVCDENISPFTLIAPFNETYSYQWFSVSSLINSSLIGQNQTLEIDLESTFYNSVYLQIEQEGCFSEIFEISIIQESIPELDVTFEYTASNTCAPSILQLEAAEIVNSSSIVSFFWEGPNGFTSTLASPTIATNGIENNGEYILTIFTIGGCTNSYSLFISEVVPSLLPNPIIDLIGNQCEGEELILSIAGQYGSNATFDWSFPSNAEVSGQGTNELSLTAFDDNFHLGSYSVRVTEDSCVSMADTILLAPIASILIPEDNFCEGSNIQLLVESIDGVAFNWSGPQGFSSTQKNPWLFNISEENNGLYTLEITRSNGCRLLVEALIDNILPAQDNGSVFSTGPICNGDIIRLSTNLEGQHFDWISPLGLLDNQEIIEGLSTSTPSTEINENSEAYLSGDWKVMVTDHNGCTSISSPASVGINEVPRAEIIGDVNLCEGDTLKLFAAQIDNANYEWTINDSNTNIDTLIINQSIEIENVQAGLISISLSVNSDGCPSSEASESILVNNAPSASPSFEFAPSANCSEFNVELISNASGQFPVSYTWTGPNGFFSTEQTPNLLNISENNLGAYTLRINDADNCDSEVIEVNISKLPEEIQAPKIVQDGLSCAENTIQLIANTQNETGIIYNWVGPNNTSSNIIISEDTLTILSLDNTLIGNYSVEAIYPNCAINSQDVEIDLLLSPSISLSTNDELYCIGDSLLINSNSTNAISYLWHGPNGFTGSSENIGISNASDLNNGLYELTVIANSGCTVSESLSVDFIPSEIELPMLNVASFCEDQPFIFSTDFQGVMYEWISPLGQQVNLPEAGMLNTISNELIIDTDNIFYLEGPWQVVVTDSNGCQLRSEFVEVNLQDDVQVSLIVEEQVCSGEDIILSTNNIGSTYEWNFTPTDINIPTININTEIGSLIIGPEEAAYLDGFWALDISSGDGCISTSSAVLVQLVDTAVPAVFNAGPYCLSQSTIQLFADFFQEADYSWYREDPITGRVLVSSQQNPTIEVNDQSDFIQYSLVIDKGDCSTERAFTEVFFFEEPMVNIQSELMVAPDCSVSEFQLFSNASGNAPFNYFWTGPNGFTSSLEDPIVSGSLENDLSGVYTLSIMDNNGCTSSMDINMDLNEGVLTPTINGDTIQVCTGESLSISSPLVIGNTVSYLWTGPKGSTADGIYQDSNDLTVSEANLQDAGIYNLRVLVDGCLSDISENIVVEVNNPPEVTIVADSMVCLNTTIEIDLTTNIVSGQGPFTFTWIGPNQFQSNEQSPRLTNLSTELAGDYAVSVIDANGCYVESRPIDIVIQDILETPIIEPFIDQVCEGEQLVLQVENYDSNVDEYTWFFETGNVIVENDSVLVIDSVLFSEHQGTITVMSTINGCFSQESTSLPLEVFPHPVLTSIFNSSELAPVCVGDTVRLEAPFIEGANYTWVGPDNFTSTLQNLELVNISSQNAGIYTLVAEVNACLSEEIQTEVFFFEEPILNVQSEVAIEPDCSVSEFQLFSNVSGSPPFNYLWTGPNGFSSSIEDPILNNSFENDLSGLYTLGVVDNNGCSSTTEILIELDDGVPAPNISSDSIEICVGESLSISSPILMGTNVSYLWTGPKGSTANGIYQDSNELLVQEVNAQDAGIYTLSVLVDGCRSDVSENIVVEINDRLELFIDTSPMICLNATTEINLTANILSGQAPYSFSWTGPNQFQSDEQNPILTNVGPDSEGLYALSVIDASGCFFQSDGIDIAIQNIIETPAIEPFNTQICEGESLVLQVENYDADVDSYTWFFKTGNMIVQTDSILVIDSVLFLEHNGAITVVSTVNDCSSEESFSLLLDVIPNPVLTDINNSSSISAACVGDTVLLEAPFIDGANYLWTGPDNFTSNKQSLELTNITLLNAGTYTLVVEVNACISDQIQTEVFVDEVPSTPIIIPTDTICSGTDVELFLLNPDSSLTYQWFTNDTNEMVGQGFSLLLENIEVTDAGFYYVIAYSQNCNSEPSLHLPINVEESNAFTAFAGEDDNTCIQDYLLGQDSSLMGNGVWSNLSNGTASILEPNEFTTLVVDLEEGTNEFVWTIDALCINKQTDTISISYTLPPIANDDFYELRLNEELEDDILQNDLIRFANYTVSLLSQPSGGQLEHNPNGTFRYTPEENFIGDISYEYSICYDFCPEDCDEATVIFRIGEEAECLVPNVFTPNGDGVNDRFVIPFIGKYRQSKICIFNRWGDEVYTSDDYQGEWDGNYEGQTLPMGTYYFILEVNDTARTIKNGYIFLHR